MHSWFFSTAGVALALASSMHLSPPAGAAGEGGPAFQPGSLPSAGNTHYEMSVSEDKQAAIVIFDGVEAQVDGIGAAPLATRLFTIAMPIEGGEKGVKMGVFLEGSAFNLKGTDISLVTTVNGVAHVLDFAKFAPDVDGLENEECKQFRVQDELETTRRKAGGTPPAQKPGKPKPDEAMKPEIDSSYVQCILFEAPSASDLRVNIVLLVNRRDKDSAGYLNVSSLNMSFRP